MKFATTAVAAVLLLQFAASNDIFWETNLNSWWSSHKRDDAWDPERYLDSLRNPVQWIFLIKVYLVFLAFIIQKLFPILEKTTTEESTSQSSSKSRRSVARFKYTPASSIHTEKAGQLLDVRQYCSFS